MRTVADLLDALNVVTGGRMVDSLEEASREEHPFVLWKSSGIPGKEVLEIPGLIHGDKQKKSAK